MVSALIRTIDANFPGSGTDLEIAYQAMIEAALVDPLAILNIPQVD